MRCLAGFLALFIALFKRRCGVSEANLRDSFMKQRIKNLNQSCSDNCAQNWTRNCWQFFLLKMFQAHDQPHENDRSVSNSFWFVIKKEIQFFKQLKKLCWRKLSRWRWKYKIGPNKNCFFHLSTLKTTNVNVLHN